MPSNREILRRVQDLAPEAAQNEPDQHVVSKVILKQFAEPWGAKGEVLLAGLNVRHPERKIVRGGPARFGKIPNYLRFASSSAEDLWGATETRLHEPLEAIKRGNPSPSRPMRRSSGTLSPCTSSAASRLPRCTR